MSRINLILLLLDIELASRKLRKTFFKLYLDMKIIIKKKKMGHEDDYIFLVDYK